MTITYHAGRRIQGLADDRLLTTQAVYTSVTGQSTYEKLSGSAQAYSSERAGVELISTANDGKKIKIGKWKLAREGTLSGLAYMKVENSSGTVKATSTGVDVSSLILRTSGYAYVTFTLTEAVALYNGDRVYIEYTTTDGSGNFLAFGEFYNGSTTIPTGFEFTVYNKRDSGGNNPSGGWGDDGLPTYFIPDAIFDDQPVTENQITNVQSGSRFEETDTRKIYYLGKSYKVHTFTSDGTFQITSGSGNVDVLVVGGGGGGAADNYGGGGAGGMSEKFGHSVTAQSYSVVVGSGGAGGNQSGPIQGTNGSNSSFDSIIGYGGGAGVQAGVGGASGGSGGGASNITVGTGGTATQGNTNGATGYGNDGGDYGTGDGGGGGGAGAVGTNGTSGYDNAPGGAGRSNSITGSSVTYATGGDGGALSVTPVNGTDGRGDGGSSGAATPGAQAGNGGDGIVIIRYIDDGSITATGGTITTINPTWTEEV